jgi:serine/threonine protein phosphatase PrpC
MSNMGDSRAILLGGQKGEVNVLPLSTDHKLDLPMERDRIERANEMVNMGRVDGALAVSRALGGFEFKDYSNNRGSPKQTKWLVRWVDFQHKLQIVS